MLPICLSTKVPEVREPFEGICTMSLPTRSERSGCNSLKASRSEGYNSMVADMSLETEAMVALSGSNVGSLILSENC